MATTLRHIAREYRFFDSSSRKRGMVDVFNVDTCEICGAEMAAPNGCAISSTDRELASVGLTDRKPPGLDGGYSELHDAGPCCSECCYDPEARTRAARPAP